MTDRGDPQAAPVLPAPPPCVGAKGWPLGHSSTLPTSKPKGPTPGTRTEAERARLGGFSSARGSRPPLWAAGATGWEGGLAVQQGHSLRNPPPTAHLCHVASCRFPTEEEPAASEATSRGLSQSPSRLPQARRADVAGAPGVPARGLAAQGAPDSPPIPLCPLTPWHRGSCKPRVLGDKDSWARRGTPAVPQGDAAPVALAQGSGGLRASRLHWTRCRVWPSRMGTRDI